MIRHLFLIFITLLLLLKEGIAQSPPVSTPAIINHLLSQKKEIQVITRPFNASESFRILPQNKMPKQLWPENQYLVYTPGNLYLGINGTGRLYKMKNQGDTLHFVRDDSTFYLGNNFYAANFSIGDTIYSYGGYGFWKNNGLLRYYNKVAHEWEVIKTDREINSIFQNSSYFWVDAQNNRFYQAGQRIINDGLKQQSNSSVQKNKNLFVLDISKGEWTELGSLKDDPVSNPVNSPFGPLFIGTFNSYINDFIQNRKLYAKKPVIEKLKKLFTGYAPDVAYFIDSTLYFSNITLNSFDSAQLSINDFEYRGEQVYTPLAAQSDFSGNKFKKLIWLAIIPFALLISFVLYKFRKRKKDKRSQSGSNVPETDLPAQQKFNGRNGNYDHSQTFSEIEKELILFIYEKTVEEYTVSVEEINKVLGLSGKNESVQKKNRSETINDINKKWAVLCGNKNPLILRQRSEFDKRSFEYFIQPVWLEKVGEMSTAFKAHNKGH